MYRTTFLRRVAVLLAGLVLTVTAATPVPPAGGAYSLPISAAEGAPLLFVQNAGQFGAGARYQVRRGGDTLWIANTALWLTLAPPVRGLEPEDRRASLPADETGSGAHVRLTFPGANPAPVVESFQAIDTTVSYFYGSDPNQWQSAVPVYGAVRYRDLYPGIDLELHGTGGALGTRFVVRDMDALANIRLQFEGAEAVSLPAQGEAPDNVRLTTAAGVTTFPLPELVHADGTAFSFPAAPSLSGATIAAPFAAAHSAQSATLPAPAGGRLGYSTFLGGADTDFALVVALDGVGSAVVAGLTYSSDFPTTPGAYDRALSGIADIFVTKFDPSGGSLVYSTFIGGTETDEAYAIALDSAGNAYLTGRTNSANFPVTPGAYDITLSGSTDGFVTRLNATGSALGFSTYLGGSGWEWGNSLVVHAAGAIYIAGYTESADFPTTPGAYDVSHAGISDGFATKLNENGSTLGYSTFLGGNGDESAAGIAVNALGGAYVTGYTFSDNFPTTAGAYDTSANGGTEGFVTRFNVSGSGLVYSTYLGGAGSDFGLDIAPGSAGNFFVTGRTTSTGFPVTAGAYDVTHNGDTDGFVTKINSDGSGLVYSTFLGGAAADVALNIAVDDADNAYVGGYTGSSAFPTSPDGYDRTYNGNSDGFVTKITAPGSALDYSTFLGGVLVDGIYTLAVDATGLTVAAGTTYSPNFPTTAGAYDTQLSGQSDGFVSKLELGDVVPPTATPTAPATLPPTSTATPGSSATPNPSVSPTPTVTPNPSISPTPTVTPNPSISPTATVTPTHRLFLPHVLRD